MLGGVLTLDIRYTDTNGNGKLAIVQLDPKNAQEAGAETGEQLNARRK
jgi:hypothetical protein